MVVNKNTPVIFMSAKEKICISLKEDDNNIVLEIYND